MAGLLHPAVSAKRIWLASGIAIAADAAQIGFFPVFAEGILSPLNMAVDVIVAALLILLVGWHIAFLPSFLLESVPFADLAPTWTVAVFIATRNKRATTKSTAN
jgi:hypothetical protein